jgi:uncharacterized protein (DUF58 family)
MQLRDPVPGSRFIDPAVLAKIGNLEFVARSVVDGVINGSHRSPYFGASVDFAEHRGYVQGDDIRRVDWRVFARTDKYYIKEFEADSNANFSVLLDVSKSMTFGQRISKLDYAKTLAACLIYLVSKQRDRVQAKRPGRLGPPLRKLAEHFGRRGIVVVISDFYEEPDEILDAVSLIRFRGNDVILFHVLDPAEIDFTFDDASSFEDLESGEQLPVVPDALRDQYRAMIREHVAALTAKAATQRVDYNLLNTSSPLDYALFNYMSIRDRLSRTR